MKCDKKKNCVHLVNPTNLVQPVMREQAGLLNFTETDGMLGIRKRAEWDLEGFEAPHRGITFVPKEASSSHVCI